MTQQETEQRLAELRRLAEGATRGPWEHNRLEGMGDFWRPNPHFTWMDAPGFSNEEGEANAAYIAAMNPETTLWLLGLVEKCHDNSQ